MACRFVSLGLAFLTVLGLAGSASGQDGKVHLLWLGQACFRITTPGGKNIMIDPFILKNPKTPAEWKDLDKLGKIDLVLVTHAHFDHVADAPALVKKNHVPMWGPAGLADTLAELGILSPEEAPRMRTPKPRNVRFTSEANRSGLSSSLRTVLRSITPGIPTCSRT